MSTPLASPSEKAGEPDMKACFEIVVMLVLAFAVVANSGCPGADPLIPGVNDSCPDDPNKTSPGLCGCGVSDVDTDGDGTPDCNEPTAALPAQTIGYDLVGIHDPQSSAYNADCISCHGDRTNEVALDGVTPAAHSRMLFQSFGTGNARCLKCHINGADFLSFSAGGLREPVNLERVISGTGSSCTSCHSHWFYARGF